MKEILLNNLELKTFTEQDVLDYCQINSIDSDKITELNLVNNELTDISGIKLFKNLENLWLNYNKITDISILKNSVNLKVLNLYNNEIKDISFLKDLTDLEWLNLNNNEIKNILILKDLKKLKYLCLGFNKIKDISVIQNFKDLELLDIKNLKLESDQIEYIKSLKNIEELYCYNGFKNMNVIKQLNKNIEIIIGIK